MKKERKRITKKGIVVRVAVIVAMILIFALLNFTTFGEWDLIGAAKEYIILALIVGIIGLVVDGLFRLSYVVDPKSKEYLSKNQEDL